MYDAKRIEELDTWLKEKNIDDIECMVADLAGIARGKSMPRVKFIEGLKTRGLRMPETVFGMTIHGDYAINEYLQEIDRDVILMPDLDTVCTTPWQPEPTAAVICDSELEGGEPVEFAPRQILKRVLALYEAEGWQPIVAPEFEFYLIDRQDNVEANPIAPVGQSGRRDIGSAPYSIDSLDEFAPYFDEVYDSCEAQNINVDTLIHEAGPAQFEFNVIHGPALNVADQSFLFKRIIRQVAIRHNMFATFMASPYSDNFGSAMHIHQSVCDMKTGENIFANEDGSDSDLFMSHIAGLQKYMHHAIPLIAPYPNSYRRFSSGMSSPTNTHWGRENRSVGLRLPAGPKAARRVENRIAGSDVNPYFALATSLACGYLGMKEGLKPSPEFKGSAYEARSRALPGHFLDGIQKMRNCEPLIEVLGQGFVETYLMVKEMEYENYSSVLNPWEKKYLMLSV
ncbi:glutamine synthetase family protein [Kordiimonas marina]|uniref:glutamine synthetase family protein n=1 Tax=Kordiimonas marina TaxID=2872312 RepID=UPI001FF2D228|nr:glutamine synthetase family protein [Kordiimonas marina]MCJ9430278.1 glutamine synthetase family protein [Kordiimonas marina]